MELESQILEYKREYTDMIKKTVIAFANTIGGRIIIGVNVDLSICGVDDVDNVMLQLTSSINDTIKPDITMFVQYTTEIREDKSIIIVEVQKGTACPYYLRKKGIRPEGVFVRQGSSSLPATETVILNMIKDTSGDNFEEIRSLEQNLTFNICKEEFSKANVKLENEQMRSLNLIGTDGLYSNLAMLLSDQCVSSIKVAIYQGTTKEIFKDRFEFTGSLFKQLRECFEFIDRNNSTRSEINGLDRIDFRAYPSIAIREALLNAVIHRDYSFNSSTLISIFDDKIEIVTIGGLLRGINIDDIKLGISVLRNRNLGNVFYRLNLIESYGTGVVKIIESYNNFSTPPKIEVSDNAFKITLWDNNYNAHLKTENPTTKTLSQAEEKIINLYNTKAHIIRKDVENLLNIGQTQASTYIKVLIDKAIISKTGSGKGVIYVLA